MSIAAAGAAFLSLRIDHDFRSQFLPSWALLFTGGSDGARDVIGVVAASIITVAGVTFSISIVILSLASQQFGPRLLRVFMRDRSIHFTFGIFIATFVYSLLILPSIHSGNGSELSEFIPRFGVSVSIVLAITCVFVLIYFIHHIAQSIQPTYLLAETSRELLTCIQNNCPLGVSEGASLRGAPEERSPWTQLEQMEKSPHLAPQSGFFQAINIDALTSLALKHGVFLEVDVEMGDYLARDDLLLNVYSAPEQNPKLADEINPCFSFGGQKTLEQDLRFGFKILTEVAVRALSPSLNDPYTALLCIDYIREAFKVLAQRQVPPNFHRDQKGTVRLKFKTLSFGELLNETVTTLFHYGKDSPLVLAGLEKMLTSLRPEPIQSLNAIILLEWEQRVRRHNLS